MICEENGLVITNYIVNPTRIQISYTTKSQLHYN